MKGDFSIDRFDSTKHFNRVLKQQGRVDLDADWNEQASIAQHQLRTLIVDLFGRAAGPRANCIGILDWKTLTDAEKEALKKAGLTPAVGDFLIGPGRYYVDGLLVESEGPFAYSAQADWSGPRLTTGKSYVAYLDVWERHVTYVEDDSIREVALGGPDTCTRVQTVWQVKVLEASGFDAAPTGTRPAGTSAAPTGAAPVGTPTGAPGATVTPALEGSAGGLVPLLPVQPCVAIISGLRGWKSGLMTARLDPGEMSDSPCVLSPDSKYRGFENQLYRVEIHRSSENPDNKPATFKWSRENGSIVTPWLGTDGASIRVAGSRGFGAGDWVEVTDSSADYQGNPGKLYQVQKADRDLLTLDTPLAWNKKLVDPLIRRWDQKANDELKLDEGAITIEPGKDDAGWIEIENGIQVQFSDGNYRTGDYWLIPARVVSGDIVWPRADGKSVPRSPDGIEHHYAPLGLIDATAAAPFLDITEDCRCQFNTLPCWVKPT